MKLVEFSHYPKQKQGKTYVYTGKDMNRGNFTYFYNVKFNKDKSIKEALTFTVFKEN